MSPRRLPFFVRHDRVLLLAAFLLTVTLAVWGSGTITGRFNHGITRTTSTCAQVDRLYSAVAQLAADDPSFTPGQVNALWQQRADRLIAQGCKP